MIKREIQKWKRELDKTYDQKQRQLDENSVLFVSEKSAALEVVKRRLDDRNLGDFCLECHSHKANKKAVVKELARCLQLDQEEYPDQRRELEDLQAVRNRLNHYVRALHRRREPLGIAAYRGSASMME